MKRKDITPGKVYSLLSYRDSRQGWPVMILSKDSYQKHHRTHVVDIAGNDRLVQGDYRRSAVGLIVVKLGFSMNEGEDVLDFRAKVDQVRERASVVKGLAALNVTDKAWDDRDHLNITDDEGNVLGHYELLTGLQMVQGPYIALTLAERQAQAQSRVWADELEQQRVAAVARHNGIAGRLGNLGIMIARAADYEHPSMVKMTFEQAERLLSLAESADRANKQAGIGT